MLTSRSSKAFVPLTPLYLRVPPVQRYQGGHCGRTPWRGAHTPQLSEHCRKGTNEGKVQRPGPADHVFSRPAPPSPTACGDDESACSGRASPKGAGGGGGPPAESLEPRLPQQELGAHRPQASPALKACCQVPCPSPPATSALPQPPTLSSSLGKSPPSLRPSRLPMKSPQVMRFPMFYWRAQRPVSFGGVREGRSFASQALKSPDGVFPSPSPQPPYSRGRGDPY